MLLDPGDVVLVELPTYTGAITAFRNVQADMAACGRTPTASTSTTSQAVLARERAAGRRVRFLYVVPNFQNPTGLLHRAREAPRGCSSGRTATRRADRRGRSLRRARTSRTRRRADDTRPIKADDHDGRVIYLSSFSKTLAPGFRVAWIDAPRDAVGKLEMAKQAADLLTPALDQRVVYEAYRRGILTARLPMLRKHYQDKRDVMQRRCARSWAARSRWPEPRGGFFLWASLPDGLRHRDDAAARDRAAA